jgi:hypothetical protein
VTELKPGKGVHFDRIMSAIKALLKSELIIKKTDPQKGDMVKIKEVS